MKTCDADKDACVVLVGESSTSRRVWLRPRGSGGMDTFKVEDTIPSIGDGYKELWEERDGKDVVC